MSKHKNGLPKVWVAKTAKVLVAKNLVAKKIGSQMVLHHIDNIISYILEYQNHVSIIIMLSLTCRRTKTQNNPVSSWCQIFQYISPDIKFVKCTMHSQESNETVYSYSARVAVSWFSWMNPIVWEGTFLCPDRVNQSRKNCTSTCRAWPIRGKNAVMWLW